MWAPLYLPIHISPLAFHIKLQTVGTLFLCTKTFCLVLIVNHTFINPNFKYIVQHYLWSSILVALVILYINLEV